MQDDSSNLGLEQVVGADIIYESIPHVPVLEPGEIALWRKVDLPHYGTRMCALDGRIEMLVSAIKSEDWTKAKKNVGRATAIYESIAERYTKIPIQELNFHFPTEDIESGQRLMRKLGKLWETVKRALETEQPDKEFLASTVADCYKLTNGLAERVRKMNNNTRYKAYRTVDEKYRNDQLTLN